MSRQIGTKTLFIFFVIIVTILGNNAFSVVPASVIEPIKAETFSQQSGKVPHSELEGTHFHLTTAGHTLIKKNVLPFYLSSTTVFYNPGSSLVNFQIRKLSLLIKDYLFHIYPTHNFW
jgi:hypothetical protein